MSQKCWMWRTIDYPSFYSSLFNVPFYIRWLVASQSSLPQSEKFPFPWAHRGSPFLSHLALVALPRTLLKWLPLLKGWSISLHETSPVSSRAGWPCPINKSEWEGINRQWTSQNVGLFLKVQNEREDGVSSALHSFFYYYFFQLSSFDPTCPQEQTDSFCHIKTSP